MVSADGPRIGVVVPVYNVEPYLAECLASIAGQSVRDLDVVIVDDGSTDDSARIAAEFAARDPRFRLVRQDNGGLGSARNTGVRNVGGTYLSFVDSDDVLPEHAFEVLAGSLEQTGSDIAAGNVMLLTGSQLSQSPMHRRPLGVTRLRTHITRDKLLMYDRLVPNKLFRRAFWDQHDLRFPEGVLYEDIPVSIPAHFLASAVDVISEPVYHWRQRTTAGADGAAPSALSITQRRTEPRAVADRFAAIGAVSRFLAAHGFREHKRAYDVVALRSDLRIFLDLLRETDEEFQARFGELAGEFLGQVDRSALEQLPAALRLKWHLVGRGLLPEVLKVLEYERRGTRVPVARRLWRRYGKYPFWRDRRVRVPRWVFRLREELAVRARLEEVRWRRGRLRITGYAYLTNVSSPFPWSSVKAIAVREEGTGRTRVLPARNRRSRAATAAANDPRRNHDWAGLSFTLDPRRLRSSGRWVDGTWLVAAGVYGRGVARYGALAAAPSGSGAHPAYRYVADDVRVIPMFTRGGTLRIRVETVRATITAHRLTDSALEITGRARDPLPADAALLLRHPAGTVAARYPLTLPDGGDGPDRREFTARIPLAGLPRARRNPLTGAEPDDGGSWQLDLDLGAAGAGQPVRLVVAEPTAEGRYPCDGREFVLHRSRFGYAWLKTRTPRPIITGADLAATTTAASLVITGDYDPVDGSAGAAECELLLRSRDQRDERVFPMTWAAGRFRAELPVGALHTLGGVLPLPAGKWSLRVRHPNNTPDGTPDGIAGGGDLAVMLDHALLDRLPIETAAAGRRYVFGDHGYDQPVLEVHSDLRPGERGAYRQRRVRMRHYRAGRRIGRVRPAVLYDSYTGKQYSDSPRAIHQELVRRQADVEHLWVVRDAQVELPDTVRPVRLWGAEWYDALARSQYVVTNAHLPEWFRRRPGQVVVQTWHGTPLKRIGFDITDVQFANARYLDKLAKEVPNWDYLVSPNPFSTPILRRAFRYEGRMIETGYPRNDMLAGPDRDLIAKRVRERLGIPAGKRAVLYAPTWRDDSFYGPGKYRLDLRLDLDRAAGALAGDHVLLVRRHPNVVDTVPTPTNNAARGFVRDVSGHPDVAELFLAADVLLTDYSSLMFDYANTGRPMLFFTYDLEHYRDRLRGFYFDFEQQAPGPLLGTSDQVIDALRAIDQVAHDHAEPYARFAERFCTLDDGKAADRVIDEFFRAG